MQPPILTAWTIKRSGPSLTVSGTCDGTPKTITGVSVVMPADGDATARNKAGEVVAILQT